MFLHVNAILSGKLFYVKSNKAKVTFMAADIQFHYIEKHKSFDKFCSANKLYRLKTSALAITNSVRILSHLQPTIFYEEGSEHMQNKKLSLF